MRQEQLPDVPQCELCDEDGRVTGELDEDGCAIARRLRPTAARPPAVRAGVQATATRRSRNHIRKRIAISTSRTVATQQQCVRCPPVQAVLPTKKGHPHRGAPWCGCVYRCGALTCGWMSTTHAWWPKSVGILIAEATLIGVLTAVAALAGAARPRMAAASPLATTAANPNLFIVVPSSSFCFLLCSSRGAKSRFGGSVGP